MVKGLLKLLGLLLIFFVVAVGATLFYLDRLARVAIEHGGSYALGVNTRVDSVSIRPLAGHFGLSGFTVDNPSGFDRPNFLVIDQATLDFDIATIREDVIRSPLFALSGIRLDLEKNSRGSNYDAILNNLERFEAGGGSGPNSSDDPGESVRFVLDEVTIRDINAEVTVFALGDVQQRVAVHVPEVVLHNVGSDGAVDLAELTDVILKAILQAVVESGGLPGPLAGDLRDSLDDLTALPGSFGQQATGLIDQAAKELNEGIQKALGGLFGGEDD